jgi:flagella basal body P-ring formation protein FlgA
VSKRLLHPIVLVAIATLAMMWARLAAAQVPSVPTAQQHVPVATRNIARGAVLTADDFEYRDTTSHAPADTNKVAAGWVARRTIMAGEILRAPAVEAPAVVNANSPVQVEFSDGNVRLTVQGTATRNGSLGERVPVRMEFGKRVEGVVVAPGRVRVD